MTDKFKTIRQTRTSDLIVKEIWDLILKGDLKPGDKLPPERELMRHFGVSMVTLREALQTLESYGHITKKRGVNGGSIVLDIAPTKGINLLIDYLKQKKFSVDDLIEAKGLIDPLIGALAFEKLDSRGKQALAELMAEHRKDYESRGASKCGWKYYTLLGELTGNPILMIIAELLTRLIMEIEFACGVSDLDAPIEQHEYNKTAFESHSRVADAFINKSAVAVKQELARNAKAFAHAVKGLQPPGGSSAPAKHR